MQAESPKTMCNQDEEEVSQEEGNDEGRQTNRKRPSSSEDSLPQKKCLRVTNVIKIQLNANNMY